MKIDANPLRYQIYEWCVKFHHKVRLVHSSTQQRGLSKSILYLFNSVYSSFKMCSLAGTVLQSSSEPNEPSEPREPSEGSDDNTVLAREIVWAAAVVPASFIVSMIIM